MNLEFEKDIVLENAAALLRPLRMADFSHLLPIALGDKTLLQFSPKPIYSEELLRDYIQKSVEERTGKSRYSFIIFDKRKITCAGSTSFLNISNYDSRLEIGATWIAREFHQTGLNRNCKFLLLSYAFDTLGAKRVEFKTDERNLASRNAIEKIGGQFEGVLRSHTVMYDGFRRNTYYYSILKNEWEKLKPAFLRD